MGRDGEKGREGDLSHRGVERTEGGVGKVARGEANLR